MKVLLLGSTNGQSTVGLLHLAAYLRRNGIEAWCQVVDQNRNRAELKENVKSLLTSVAPDLVGVSLKWFQHMARGVEICQTIKEYSPHTRTVVGGNTASYFWKQLIEYPCIDYIIRGDGELPLLKLCRGDAVVPNCVSKHDGAVVEAPFDYVQDEVSSADIYLSHLDEIAWPRESLSRVKQLFIYTGKGCAANCFYCGGCREASLRNFNRQTPFIRNVVEARKDLLEARKHFSAFLFDFEFPGGDLTGYHRELWHGIDLSDSSCSFYCWTLPPADFLELLAGTFREPLVCIDLCSLSERLRLDLSAQGIVKPQPTDQELIACLDECRNHPTIRVEIDIILGMPGLTLGDLQQEEAMVTRLLKEYPCFSRLSWGRLHAQPGAPIVASAEKFGMYSLATTFEQFMEISTLNLNRAPYPEPEEFSFPAIYHTNRSLMARTIQHYVKLNSLLENRLAES